MNPRPRKWPIVSRLTSLPKNCPSSPRVIGWKYATRLGELPAARAYAEAASSANTRRAYASDWRHFFQPGASGRASKCCRPTRIVGLYITACASGSAATRKANSVSTIRLSSLTWNYAQRGQPLDRQDRHIATVIAGIRNTHAAPPSSPRI